MRNRRNKISLMNMLRSTSSGASPPAGTVLFQMDFEDGTNGNQDAMDASPSARTITWYDVAKCSDTVFTPNGSVWLNCTDNESSIRVDPVELTGDFCIEYYWYVTDHGPTFEQDHVVSNTANAWGHYEGVNNGWELRFAIAGLTLGNNFTVTEGQWRHLACTREGSTVTLYVDGVVNSSGTSSATVGDTTGDLFFGAGSASPSTAQDGNVSFDQIRITDGSHVYSGPFTPPTSF